jgi:hypothetical protein
MRAIRSGAFALVAAAVFVPGCGGHGPAADDMPGDDVEGEPSLDAFADGALAFELRDGEILVTLERMAPADVDCFTVAPIVSATIDAAQAEVRTRGGVLVHNSPERICEPPTFVLAAEPSATTVVDITEGGRASIHAEIVGLDGERYFTPQGELRAGEVGRLVWSLEADTLHPDVDVAWYPGDELGTYFRFDATNLTVLDQALELDFPDDLVTGDGQFVFSYEVAQPAYLSCEGVATCAAHQITAPHLAARVLPAAP